MLQKEEVQKVVQLTYFQTGKPMILVQKWPFLTFLFLAIQARKMSFTIFYNEKTPFQAIKTTSSKCRLIDIFPNGLSHGFGPRMVIFPTVSFQAIQARKTFFTIFYNGKKAFQAIKTRSSKSGKSDTFPKGLTHDFCLRMVIFPFFFLIIQVRKVSLTIFQKEKTPFYAIKTRSSKRRKIDIFLNGLTHCLCPKMAIFSNFFFLGNTGQENVFYDILERENAFLGYKKKKFKQS